VTVAPQAIQTDRAPGGGTLRVESQFALDYIDPALADLVSAWQLLLRHLRRTGLAGSRLTAEASTSPRYVSSTVSGGTQLVVAG
jgi:hypothetical protein